jgi:Fe-S-cluster containining protein
MHPWVDGGSANLGLSSTPDIPMATQPELLQILDGAIHSAVVRSGAHLVCRPGCAQCCHGVFEVSALDAGRLRDGLANAPADVQDRIVARVRAAREHLGPFFPGDLVTGVLHPDAEALELFEEWAHADPCPILDPATQTCDLYAARPVLCRTFGPPIRNDPDDLEAGLAICELCFTEATQAEILAAEVDSGFRAVQEAEEAAYEAAHPGCGPTIIAFAF